MSLCQTLYFEVEADILYSFNASIGCYITIFGVYYLSHVEYSMLHTLNNRQNYMKSMQSRKSQNVQDNFVFIQKFLIIYKE